MKEECGVTDPSTATAGNLSSIAVGAPPTLTQLIMPTSSEISTARRRAQGKALVIGALGICGYWGLVVADAGVLGRVISAAVLIVAVVATATSVMHDANHGALTRSARFNRMLGYSADLLGASSWLWRFKHNHLHHGNTNVVGVDSDISQAPFARLAPTQVWRPWHRYQHLYLWFLYGFLTMKWLTFADFGNLVQRRVGEQPLPRRPGRRNLALLLAGKLAHVSWALVIPLMLHPWWVVIASYLICSWVVGFTLAVVFQLAHCVDTADFAHPDEPRRGEAFELHQLRTTVDVDSRVPISRWIMGGLDHQIEHHLAPRLPHTIYPLVASRLRELCATRGIRYRLHPNLRAGLRAHGRWLKLMGQPPAACYGSGSDWPDVVPFAGGSLPLLPQTAVTQPNAV
jgi:linoleoyl-CoA desaturase